MFILSQNKGAIVKTRNISVICYKTQEITDENGNTEKTGNYAVFADDNYIGMYSPEERVQEVIGEIFDVISNPENRTYRMPEK